MIILREKRYTSNWTKFGVKVARFRNGIADKIRSSAIKDYDNSVRSANISIGNRVVNQGVTDKLLDIAENNNTNVVYGSPKSSALTSWQANKLLDDGNYSVLSDFGVDFGNYTSGIRLRNDSGIETLAHELGHIKDGDSLLYRIPRVKVSKEGRGVLGSLKNIVGGELTKARERRATRKGLNLLEQNGANQAELDKSKELLGHAYNSYVSGFRGDIKMPIANLFAISKKKKGWGGNK